MWWPLIIFCVLVVLTLVLTEINERKKKNSTTEVVASPKEPVADGECCGTHLFCEKLETLRDGAKIEYYDDEELDGLQGIPPTQYTPQQHQLFREVYETLQPNDIRGWVRSLQLRNVELPQDIREEIVLIISEMNYG